MAVPYDRKVVYKTYIIPEVIYTETLEEGTAKSYGTIFNVAEGGVGKALGAGDAVYIAPDQLTDSWTTNNSGIIWEHIPDLHNWEDYSYIVGEPSVTGPLVLRPSSGVILGGDTKFIFVKNVGDNKMLLSLDKGVSYPIIILPLASFCSRLNDIDSDNIMVNTGGEGDTLVEYLVAI